MLLSLSVFNSTANPQNDLANIVEYHRKILVLLSENDARNDVIERDTFIARNLYYQKRELLASYEELTIQETDKPSVKVLRTKYINELLSYVESDALHAGDQLAFVDLIDAILYQHQMSPFLSQTQFTKLKGLENDLEKIQQAYGKKIADLYGLLGTRGKTIEKWEDYLQFLQLKYSRKSLRNEFNQGVSDLSGATTRGGSTSTEKQDTNMVWGFGIPEKTVVLTFDDGPHYRHTDAILDTLKEYKANAYFFAVGKNFGHYKADKKNTNKKTQQAPLQLTLKKNAKKLKRAIAEGHKLGNHSFTHRVLTKLGSTDRRQEMEDTNTLLKLISDENIEFRPPYGSKDDELLKMTKELGMRSIMWNIDSLDWGDPLADSIVERVMKRLEKNKRGIILFHDIHKQTVQALPSLLKKLTEEGYSFVDIDGKPFINKSLEVENIKGTHSKTATEIANNKIKSKYYSDSWAVVVGINQYKEWPKLSYAVNDAKAIENKLIKQFGFKQDHIFSLYDQNATRDNIMELLANTMADPRKIKPNDRVFIFYAGHGMTRKLPSGRDLGYIIPVDAALDKFHSRSISMTHLRDFSEMIPAKHVYYVMDSCYSGIALTRGGGANSMQTSYLNEITNRTARQILTAGGADQQVADGGLNGHSIFTWTLLKGLDGEADLDKNHIITASELGAYISPLVANNSNQTPAFGNLLGSEGGEFVFELPQAKLQAKTQVVKEDPGSEKLALLQQELQQEVIRLKELNNVLNLKLAALRSQNVNAGGHNANSSELIDSSKYNHLSPKQRKSMSLKLHKTGLTLYKQKNYTEALVELKKAVELNPTNSSIINNYGFILYKAGKFEESLIWLEKTIELEPDRTVVYLNIADTLTELKREKEAVAYYEHYLYLFPSSDKSDEIKIQIEHIKSGV